MTNENGGNTGKSRVEEIEGLAEGSKLKIVSHTSGVSKYSNLYFSMPDGRDDGLSNLETLPIGFKWHSFTELQDDHGLALTYDVLRSSGFLGQGPKSTSNLIQQLQNHLEPRIWEQFKAQLDRLYDPGNEGVVRDSYVIAAWADLFEEKFSEVWLAAMAHDARFVEENDYAFGYLVSELDHKRHTESHYLRGERGFKNSKEGGLARSRMLKPRTGRILAEMRRLLSDGFSLSRSAELSFKNGYGTSKAANIRLWSRHAKK